MHCACQLLSLYNTLAVISSFPLKVKALRSGWISTLQLTGRTSEGRRSNCFTAAASVWDIVGVGYRFDSEWQYIWEYINFNVTSWNALYLYYTNWTHSQKTAMKLHVGLQIPAFLPHQLSNWSTLAWIISPTHSLCSPWVLTGIPRKNIINSYLRCTRTEI